MKFLNLAALLMPLVSLVAAAPSTVQFSGSLAASTANAGVSVSVAQGSSCSVEYQVLDQLGVNCTVLLDFAANAGSNKWDYTATLTGGVNLVPANGNLEAVVNYQASFPNVIAPGSVYQIPSASGVASVAFPSAISISTPVSVCLTNIAAGSNTAAGLIANDVLSLTGSNACVTINFAQASSKGASLSVTVNVDLFDVSTITNTVAKDALTTVLTTANVADKVPIKYTANIGAAIQNFAASGSVTATAGRMRGLASSTPSYIDSKGNFILGQPQALSAGAIAGIAIAVAAVVVGVAAAGVIVFRRRTAPAKI